MNTRRPSAIHGACALCWLGCLPALLSGGGTPATAATEAPAASVEPAGLENPTEDSRAWSFGGLILGYWVPGEDDYLQPTIMADRGVLHLEARYQYEALETGSVWVGYNFSGEGKVSWELTPMLGGVVGETMGVAPGFRGALGWWRLELSAETEWVFDAGEISDSFVYTWSELRVTPVEWLHLGIALQRTRVYGSDREIEWGPLAGVAFGHFDVTFYAFELDEDPLFILAVGASY